MEFAVAMKDKLGQMISSPGPIPAPMKARCRAVVQEETADSMFRPNVMGKLLFEFRDSRALASHRCATEN